MSYSLTQKRLLAGPVARSEKSADLPTLSEVFPVKSVDASAAAFVLSRIKKQEKPILWVQDRVSAKEAGRPYFPGLGTSCPILRVDVTRPADVLWALEDGLRCRALAAVIGEIWGDPPALSFTATKRLAIRAEAGKIPCWLIRRSAMPNLSAARDRWRVSALPSAPNPHDAHAPGDPRWHVELFRSRSSKPGIWTAQYDRTADRVDLIAPSVDRALDPGDGAAKRSSA